LYLFSLTSSKVGFQSRAKIKKVLSFLKRDSSKTCEEVLNTLEEYETLQKSVQDDLLKWEKCDRLTGIGYDFNSGDEILKEIRKRFQDLNSILDKIKKNLEELPSDEEKKAKKEKIEEKIDSLSNELLNSAFIVKKQSQQQVYRIDCNASKRINGLMVVNLLGGKMRQERPSNVKASIVVGTHVNDLDTLREYEIGSAKWIYSGVEADADFTKSKIEINPEKIRKLRKLGTGDARHPEERFAIVFQVTLANGYVLKATSAPICVIANDCQKQIAQASIIYSYLQNDPFNYLEELDFFEVAAALSTWMKLKCDKPLTEANILHLGYQAFKKDESTKHNFFEAIRALYAYERNLQDIQYLEESIERLKTLKFSYAQFARNPFISQNVSKRSNVSTFSDWFLSMVTLTETCFKKLWSNGCVMGFIGRQLAETMLGDQNDGTFMIRFSDTAMGGVSFVHCTINEDGLTEVISENPMFREYLKRCGTEPLLYHWDALKYLYKNHIENSIPKKDLNLHKGSIPTKIIGYETAETIDLGVKTMIRSLETLFGGRSNGHKKKKVDQDSTNSSKGLSPDVCQSPDSSPKLTLLSPGCQCVKLKNCLLCTLPQTPPDENNQAMNPSSTPQDQAPPHVQPPIPMDDQFEIPYDMVVSQVALDNEKNDDGYCSPTNDLQTINSDDLDTLMKNDALDHFGVGFLGLEPASASLGASSNPALPQISSFSDFFDETDQESAKIYKDLQVTTIQSLLFCAPNKVLEGHF